MHVVPVDAPTGRMEPAPITSLPIHTDLAGAQVSAFWTADDQYLVCAEGAEGAAWYRIETGEADADAAVVAAAIEERRTLGALLADIIPLGGGRVAFPVGSTGRRVYRVWRAAKGASGRTKILGVRAARSRRLPA
jgi:hypothetical protein